MTDDEQTKQTDADDADVKKDDGPKKDEKPAELRHEAKASEPELSVEGDGDHLVVSGSGLEPGEYELRERSATFIAALAVEADEKGEFSLTRPNALTGRLQYELFAVNADGIATAVATAEWPTEA